MIGVSTPWFWAASTGDDETATMPERHELERHVDFVRRNCDHPALCLNGSLELVRCANCSPD
jgi:hypothetical protein